MASCAATTESVQVSTQITRFVGVSSVLRLSIVVPYQDDDLQLEATLLSILENRSSDQELIVVHNGTYFDPYQLGSDELILLETPKNYSLCDQINLAVSAACSRYVEILFPGTSVTSQWADEAIDILDHDDLACVGLPLSMDATDQVAYGLEKGALPRRKLSNHVYNSVPLLNGSIFRKKYLQLVGGLCGKLPREGAELELQLLFEAMDLTTKTLDEPVLSGNMRAIFGLERGFETGRQTGLVARAYGQVEGSGVCVESLAKQLGHLASGLMNPKTVAERLGWVMGTRDGSLDETIRERLLTAAAQLDAAVQEQQSSQYRRAA